MDEKNIHTNQDSTDKQTFSPVEAESDLGQDVSVKVGSDNDQKQKFGLLIGAVVAIVAVVVGYLYMSNGLKFTDDNANASKEAVAAIEDDQVVARVNGEELFGSELKPQIDMLMQQIGSTDISTLDPQVSKQLQTQALDSIINTKLVTQAAKEEGLEATTQDVDNEFNKIVEGVGGMEAAEQRLQELGLTVDEFKATLVNDVLIRKYLEAKNDPAILAVSEEEMKAVYDQAISSAPENAPPFEEVKFQIEEQLKFQKQQQVLLEILGELRSSANIELLL
jgi:peptidyl-prolyl cis-trans isomerase SurA